MVKWQIHGNTLKEYKKRLKTDKELQQRYSEVLAMAADDYWVYCAKEFLEDSIAGLKILTNHMVTKKNPLYAKQITESIKTVADIVITLEALQEPSHHNSPNQMTTGDLPSGSQTD